MKASNITIMFNGNTEAAFNFYRSVFGGEFITFQRMKDIPGDHPMSPGAAAPGAWSMAWRSCWARTSAWTERWPPGCCAASLGARSTAPAAPRAKCYCGCCSTIRGILISS